MLTTKKLRSRNLLAVLSLAALLPAISCLAPALRAQNPQSAATPAGAVPPAPIPTQIPAAKKVFIANSASDSSSFILNYTGGPNALYDQFYAALKRSGRFELVGSPADADLVFDIEWSKVAPDDRLLVELAVRIVDPHTNIHLWTVRQEIQGAFLAKTARKNLLAAVAALATSTVNLASPPAQ